MVTTIPNEPDVVGVPEIIPVDESMLRPGGRPVAVHLAGDVAPGEVSVAAYATPTCAIGIDGGLMADIGTGRPIRNAP